MALARTSGEIGSLFGGSSWTGSLGSNFPAMLDFELMRCQSKRRKDWRRWICRRVAIWAVWGKSCRHWLVNAGAERAVAIQSLKFEVNISNRHATTFLYLHRFRERNWRLRDTDLTMFAPRFQSFIRPASGRASQCLRQRQAAIPKNSISRRIQQQRHQSTRANPSALDAARALFRAYPYSVSLAFGLYVASRTTSDCANENLAASSSVPERSCIQIIYTTTT